MEAVLTIRGRVTASYTAVLGLVPGRVGLFNFCLGLELGGIQVESWSLAFAPNIL